jgi:hypothetical protein
LSEKRVSRIETKDPCFDLPVMAIALFAASDRGVERILVDVLRGWQSLGGSILE